MIGAFTTLVQFRKKLFKDASTFRSCRGCLDRSAKENSTVVAVYCFMPDHVHLVAWGRCLDADLWKFMFSFKQYSGWWLRCNRSRFRWHRDYWDHLVRDDRDLKKQILYVLENPVRAGLVEDWRDYPFTGSIGISLDEVLAEVGL